MKSRAGEERGVSAFLRIVCQCVHVRSCLTSMEIRRWTRFLRQTPVGDCTSSEDVPDAWSLSPSEPIFRFSCTISKTERESLDTEIYKNTCYWIVNRVLRSDIRYIRLKLSLYYKSDLVQSV